MIVTQHRSKTRVALARTFHGELLKYFIECLHSHFYLFVRKKQNVTAAGHSIDKRQLRFVISSCRLYGVYSWIHLPWVPEGFFVFVLFCCESERRSRDHDRGFAAHCRRKTKQKNPLAPRVGYTRKEAQVHADMRLVLIISYCMIC